MEPHNILITGAGGYLGRQLVEKLSREATDIPLKIFALDIEIPEETDPSICWIPMDIRSPELISSLQTHHIRTVIHLAAIVTPPKNSDREFEYSVDVLGTENLLKASVKAGVKRIIVTSSGAAYGYHADNPALLTEEDPIRGNQEFSYAWHKRLVEEMLAEYRIQHPDLEQIIFRVGTILGAHTRNQITALFEKPYLIAVRNSRSPFVFIWDQDMVNCLYQAIFSPKTGIYNVAGDSTISTREMAKMAGVRQLTLSPALLKAILWITQKLGLSPYGPEQIGFLRYRPVLSNRLLKEEFGFTPQLSSREVFAFYLQHRDHP
jgi:UDP-glucose 4-epimerase